MQRFPGGGSKEGRKVPPGKQGSKEGWNREEGGNQRWGKDSKTLIKTGTKLYHRAVNSHEAVFSMDQKAKGGDRKGLQKWGKPAALQTVLGVDFQV